MGKPGPKPKPDSLTDAPVMAVKVPSTMLRGLDEVASDRGATRADVIRDMLQQGVDWWKSLTPAQKAKMTGRPWPPPSAKR